MGSSRKVLRAVGIGLALVVIGGLAVIAPVPQLTVPAGRYAVGTEIFRWVDSARPEEATADPSDRRNVVVQAWYPSQGTRGGGSAYIDGLGRLPPYVTLVPRGAMTFYRWIDTHAVLNAPVSSQKPRWPVVVFSPGYGAPRAFYTSLVSGLASHGYVVLAIDHPYEAGVTELADGRIATTVEKFSPDDPDRIAFMTSRLEVRAADVKFVVDKLDAAFLSARLDLDRIAVIGHSFGGATAAVAMNRDPRIRAAANIDGTLYGSIAEKKLMHPFLLLESDHKETRHSRRFLDGNAQLLANLEEGGYRYEITRANHYSFTDVPLFFAAPGRWLVSRLIGGSRGPGETHRATVDIVSAFLRDVFDGPTGGVETAAQRYEGVRGGKLK